MEAVTFDPRQAAAYASMVMALLLILQYTHRRRAFILIWAAGWMLVASAMLVAAHGYASARAAAAGFGFSQFLAVCAAMLFVWSADVYRETAYLDVRYAKALAPIAAWLVLAPMLLGARAALVPGDVLVALALLAAGTLYAAVLLERRMIGAGLVSFVLLGLAMSRLTAAVMAWRAGDSAAVSLQILGVNAVLSAFGALGVHLLIFEDMTWELQATNRRLEAAQAELVEAAITDPLTGCYNRRFLETVSDRELKRHERFELPLSLLYLDVNRFKQINDTLGHEAGDRVLQYVARFLRSRIREADYIFRLGGDEFLVLITCSGEEARRKASALKAAFDTSVRSSELPAGVGLSIGSIEVPADTTDLAPLVREADELMYADKTASRSGTAPPAVAHRIARSEKPRAPWKRRSV